MLKILNSILLWISQRLLENKYKKHVSDELNSEYENILQENIEAIELIKKRWLDIYGN